MDEYLLPRKLLPYPSEINEPIINSGLMIINAFMKEGRYRNLAIVGGSDERQRDRESRGLAPTLTRGQNRLSSLLYSLCISTLNGHNVFL
jgi:hypothetical protein